MGTGVGGWERLGGRDYAVTFTGFVPGGGGLRYVVTATVTLDRGGAHFWGSFRTNFLDGAGNPTFTFEGTVSASRQAVEAY